MPLLVALPNYTDEIVRIAYGNNPESIPVKYLMGLVVELIPLLNSEHSVLVQNFFFVLFSRQDKLENLLPIVNLVIPILTSEGSFLARYISLKMLSCRIDSSLTTEVVTHYIEVLLDLVAELQKISIDEEIINGIKERLKASFMMVVDIIDTQVLDYESTLECKKILNLLLLRSHSSLQNKDVDDIMGKLGASRIGQDFEKVLGKGMVLPDWTRLSSVKITTKKLEADLTHYLFNFPYGVGNIRARVDMNVCEVNVLPDGSREVLIRDLQQKIEGGKVIIVSEGVQGQALETDIYPEWLYSDELEVSVEDRWILERNLYRFRLKDYPDYEISIHPSKAKFLRGGVLKLSGWQQLLAGHEAFLYLKGKRLHTSRQRIEFFNQTEIEEKIAELIFSLPELRESIDKRLLTNSGNYLELLLTIQNFSRGNQEVRRIIDFVYSRAVSEFNAPDFLHGSIVRIIANHLLCGSGSLIDLTASNISELGIDHFIRILQDCQKSDPKFIIPADIIQKIFFYLKPFATNIYRIKSLSVNEVIRLLERYLETEAGLRLDYRLGIDTYAKQVVEELVIPYRLEELKAMESKLLKRELNVAQFSGFLLRFYELFLQDVTLHIDKVISEARLSLKTEEWKTLIHNKVLPSYLVIVDEVHRLNLLVTKLSWQDKNEIARTVLSKIDLVSRLETLQGLFSEIANCRQQRDFIELSEQVISESHYLEIEIATLTAEQVKLGEWASEELHSATKEVHTLVVAGCKEFHTLVVKLKEQLDLAMQLWVIENERIRSQLFIPALEKLLVIVQSYQISLNGHSIASAFGESNLKRLKSVLYTRLAIKGREDVPDSCLQIGGLLERALDSLHTYEL